MIKSTLVGGALFLIPLVVIAVVLGKAYQLATLVAEPLSGVLPVHRVGGVVLADLLAVLVILLLCVVAGLLARLKVVADRVRRLDQAFIELVPGYAVAKSTLSGVADVEDGARDVTPVLVRFDDYEQIAFEIERTTAGVVVFLPGAPSAWSGASVLIAPERVTALDLPPHQVIGLLRVLGRGTATALAGPSGPPLASGGDAAR
jgi:uncharacterized membrane protein